MKKILIITCLVAIANGGFCQTNMYYGYWPVLTCPDNSLFSQTFPHSGHCPALNACDMDNNISPTADNYSVGSTFNSIRFWGAWISGQWYSDACTQSPTETFYIEIFSQDPSTPGATPVYSFKRSGVLTKVGQPIFTLESPTAQFEPLYEINVDLGTDVSVLNGWISIRDVYKPGRPCYFCIVACFYTSCSGDGFYNGSFTKQANGSYSGSWGTLKPGGIYFCLSNNGLNVAGTPLRIYDQSFDSWNGISDAWQETEGDLSSSDNFSATNSFDRLTLWGAWALGEYSDPSCTVGLTETFQVEFYRGDPGAGGTLVQSLTKTATVIPTGYFLSVYRGKPIYRVDISFNPAIDITSGWVRIKNINTGGRPCKFGWLYNNNPIFGTYRDGNLESQPGGLFFCLSRPCNGGFANAGPDKTVYRGYPPLQSIRISGSGGVMYQWSPLTGFMYLWGADGPNSDDPWVQPLTTTTYTLSATDENGCVSTDNVTVNVTDVRCGAKLDKVTVCYKNKTQCVTVSQAQTMLAGGGYLGPCIKSDMIEDEEVYEFSLSAWPNPFSDRCTIRLDQPEGSNVSVVVTDLLGRQVGKIYEGFLDSGSHEFKWSNPGSGGAVYLITAKSETEFKVIKLIAQ